MPQQEHIRIVTEQKNPLVCVVNCYRYIGKNVCIEVSILVQTATDRWFLECMRKVLWNTQIKFQKYAITKRINQSEIQMW